MQITTCLAIITLAALIHASFQLSTSMLTLLSGHSLSTRHSHARLMRMSGSFLAGVATMTVLLLSFMVLVLWNLCKLNLVFLVWGLAVGLSIGMGLTIWVFYYRRHKRGTTLWIPRALAEYLTARTRKTHLSGEAFGLGLSSVFHEILFILSPMLVAAVALIYLPAGWQLIGLLIYTLVSMLSVLVVWILIGERHSLSHIQEWRETNKHFLQFAGGAGSIILGFFFFAATAVSLSAGVM